MGKDLKAGSPTPASNRGTSGAPGLWPSASVDEIRNWLSKKENRLPVDWRCIWPESSRLLTWGDNSHEGLSVKQAYIDCLPELKAVGLTHVGFEVLAQFLQEQVDEFSQLKTGDHRLPAARERLVEHLTQQWEAPPEANFKYVKMLDATRDAGLKILCLEPNIKNAMGFKRVEGFPLVAQGLKLLPAKYLDVLKHYASGQAQGPSRQERRQEILEYLKRSLEEGSKAEQLMVVVDAMSSQGFDFNEIDLPVEEDLVDEWFFIAVAEWRNRVWKQVIDRTLASGEEARDLLPAASNTLGARLLVFAGLGHIGHLDPYRTLNDELNEPSTDKYNTVSVGFAGGDAYDSVEEGRKFVEQNKSKPFSEIIKWQVNLCDAMHDVAELRDGSFAFRIADDGPNKPADYMIHLNMRRKG